MLSATRTRLPQSARLSLLYAVCFGGIGVYLPFFPVWLETRGLDPWLIGLILSLPILIRVVVTAPLMTLVDRGVGMRVMLVAASLWLALGYVLLTLAWTPAAIATLVVLCALAQAPIIPLCDLVATNAVRDDARLDYGRIRLWGSLSFLLLSVFGGYVLGATSADAVVWALAALALGTCAIVPFAVPADAGERAHGNDAVPLPATQGLPRALLYVIAAVACLQASHAAIYAFGSLHWRERGFSEPVIGYLWAAGVVAEMLVFAVGGRLIGRQSHGLGLLLLGGAASIMRFSALAFDPGIGLTFCLQALHGLSFGATHLGAMTALPALAPAGARGRG
jgi:MFS transporter, PPP family, 3-phenylpropionic acid transporter